MKCCSKPIWLSIAILEIGTSEIKGEKHNPKILAWWKKIRAHYRDDETPWCAAFVGGILERSGLKSSRSAAARSYLDWGVELKAPSLGCVVVLSRGRPGSGKGHVGFLAGKDKAGNLMIVGGNQNDKVSVAPYPQHRLLAYRWPCCYPLPEANELGFDKLPLIK